MPEENQNVEEFQTTEEIHTTNESTQFHMEVETQKKKKNTVGAVGMRFSIIGLIALIAPLIIFAILIATTHSALNIMLPLSILFLGLAGFLLLLPIFLVGFILGIIGLFRKPRGKAWVAVCVPLIVSIGLGAAIYCVKDPVIEISKRSEENGDYFDDSKFEKLLKTEINKIINDKSEDEWKDLLESSTGSNKLEKGTYMLFSITKEGFENALKKYDNELPEINEEEIDTDDEIDEDEITDEDEVIEIDEEEEEVKNNTKSENVEVFTKSEQDDIEQILDILE